MANKNKDVEFVADADAAPEEDAKRSRRAENAQRQEEAQEAANNTPRSADGTQVTQFELAENERFESLNASEGGRPDQQAAAESGAADPVAFGPEVQADLGDVTAGEEVLGPLGSATQTGGTAYYAATDIKPAYATPYYPPTDYSFAAIDAGMITADTAAGGNFVTMGLVAGDPYPPENEVQDTIETDGRGNNAAVLEMKDWHRRPHNPEFLIITSLRRADGGLPYPANPDTGGGAAGVVQDVEAPA